MIKSAALLLLFLGDLNFTGMQYMNAFEKAGYDPAFSFLSASPLIQAADLAFANLEGPLTFAEWSPESKKKKWRFRQLPLFAKGIKSSGIDILFLGNNHIADAGDKGIQDTLDVLKEEGLSWVPSPHEGPLVIDRDGMQVEIWNADVFSQPKSHPWALGPQELAALIEKRYKGGRKGHLVIVYVHGHFPKREQMDKLAVRLRDSGADWVLFGGAHSSAEMIANTRGGLHYGLGDFIFGCECSGAPEGKMLTLEAGEGEVVARELTLTTGSPVNGFRTQIN